MAKYTVAVAGATGYAGGEALRILAAHPNFEVTCMAGHSSVGDKLGKHMPHIPQLADLVVEDTTPEVLNGHDVIILALPHGASGALASQLDPNAVVVDLGADHRLEEKPHGMSSTAATSMNTGLTACLSSLPAYPKMVLTSTSVR